MTVDGIKAAMLGYVEELERNKTRSVPAAWPNLQPFRSFQGYIFWPFPPPPLEERKNLSKLKNREEFKVDLKKVKEGKEKNKEKSDKTHVQMPL